MKTLRLLVLILLTGCKGGFYVLENAANLSTSINSTTTSYSDKYLTTTISIENTALLTDNKNFNTSRNKELSHLYIYAEAFNPLLKVKTQIPLLLYKNGDNPSVEIVESGSLLIKYPLNDIYRNNFSFKLQSLALEKEKSQETAQFIYDLAKPLVKDVAISPVASAAVDIASQIFEKSYSSKDYRYERTVNLSEIYTGAVYRAYMIFPLDNNDSILDIYRGELKKSFIVKKLDGKFKLFNGSILYERLPYIIVSNTFDDYFADADLFPQYFEPNLEFLTTDMITGAENKLSTIQSSILTSKQFSFERYLLTKLKFYKSFQNNLNSFKQNNSKEENIINLINSFLEYKSLISITIDTAYYNNYYKTRINTIDKKVLETFKNEFPFSTIVINSINHFQFDDFENLKTFSEGEAKLRNIQSIIRMIDRADPKSDNYKSLQAIQKSNIYLRAQTDVIVLENKLFDLFLFDKTNELISESDCTPKYKELANELKLSLTTNCTLCRQELLKSINEYSVKCPAVNKDSVLLASVIQNSMDLSNIESTLKISELLGSKLAVEDYLLIEQEKESLKSKMKDILNSDKKIDNNKMLKELKIDTDKFNKNVK